LGAPCQFNPPSGTAWRAPHRHSRLHPLRVPALVIDTCPEPFYTRVNSPGCTDESQHHEDEARSLQGLGLPRASGASVPHREPHARDGSQGIRTPTMDKPWSPGLGF
jgi:hypothetical protein